MRHSCFIYTKSSPASFFQPISHGQKHIRLHDSSIDAARHGAHTPHGTQAPKTNRHMPHVGSTPCRASSRAANVSGDRAHASRHSRGSSSTNATHSFIVYFSYHNKAKTHTSYPGIPNSFLSVNTSMNLFLFSADPFAASARLMPRQIRSIM